MEQWNNSNNLLANYYIFYKSFLVIFPLNCCHLSVIIGIKVKNYKIAKLLSLSQPKVKRLSIQRDFWLGEVGIAPCR